MIGAFMFASPFFVSPDLVYPLRVDSLYVKYESEQVGKTSKDQNAKSLPVLYNPSSIGLKYENMDVKTQDGLMLHGWYVSASDEESNTLLIIHDLSESKINYINLVKQMHDRGLNVCVMDMRAHGNSEGTEFTPGMVTVSDFKNIVDELFKKPGTNHLAVFGAGIGAAVAVQVASLDSRCEVLVAQSPFSDFSGYVENYSRRKWGRLTSVFKIILERELEKRLQYELTDLDLSEIIKYVKTPSLFICGSNDEITRPFETYAVYDSSGAEEKNLILVKKAGHHNIEQLGGEDYYNSITRFIVNAIPKKTKETRYRKLAVL